MWKFYARLRNGNCERLFEVIDYKDGMYHVYIDFIFPMQLKRLVVRQVIDAA